MYTHHSRAGRIRADQIQDTIRFKFPDVLVSKDLISRIARKAHDRTYGKGVSDVFQLKDYGKAWEEKGGTFTLVYGRDLGKTGPEEEKMMGIIMVTPYAHLIVDAYGDLFCADGTHGIAHYGWRALFWRNPYHGQRWRRGAEGRWQQQQGRGALEHRLHPPPPQPQATWPNSWEDADGGGQQRGGGRGRSRHRRYRQHCAP